VGTGKRFKHKFAFTLTLTGKQLGYDTCKLRRREALATGSGAGKSANFPEGQAGQALAISHASPNSKTSASRFLHGSPAAFKTQETGRAHGGRRYCIFVAS
jgi:hypothetical protein